MKATFLMDYLEGLLRLRKVALSDPFQIIGFGEDK